MAPINEDVIRKVSQAMTKQALTEGKHTVTVEDVTVRQLFSKYTKTYEDFVDFHLMHPDGIVLHKLDKLTGSKKSNLYHDMKCLGCLPKEDEPFDLNQLIGMEVEVIVENVIKDGVTFSNVMEIRAIKVVKPPRTHAPITMKRPMPQKPQRVVVSEPVSADDYEQVQDDYDMEESDSDDGSFDFD